MLEFFFQDDQYPFVKTTHLRKVARAIVLDEKNRIALHEIFRDDMFCKQAYLETPGGGVDEGENFEEAVVRECEEEIGYRIEILCALCDVHDYYNLIGRKNHNRYFLARRGKEVGKHFASQGDTYIQRTIYLPIDEAIRRYEEQEDTLVAKIVKRRELAVLRVARTKMKELGLLK